MQSSSRKPIVAAVAALALVVAAWWYLTQSPTKVSTKPTAGSSESNTVEQPGEEPSPPSRPVVSVSPPVSVPRGQSKPPNVIASASWGSGKDQIGRNVPEEGNPEGPMSFSVAPDGSLIVLDQINDRLARYDRNGKRLGDTNIDSMYPQDVAVGANGTTAVLDRLRDKKITLMNEDGRVVGSLPLEGAAIGETGGVTGVFVDGDKVYVEREHGKLVEVGSTDGKAAEEPEELPGRPSRDGTLLLSAGIVDAATGRMFVSAMNRAVREKQFTRELRLDDPVLQIVLLDSDKQGTIYVAAMIGVPEAPQDNVRVQLVCLDPALGEPIGSAVLPASDLADETFRDLVVLDEGGVVHAERTESGITYRVYTCS